jgi:hypothetical protein
MLGDGIVEDGGEETRRTSVSATNLYPLLGTASAVVENLTKLGTADSPSLKKNICPWIRMLKEDQMLRTEVTKVAFLREIRGYGKTGSKLK